MEWKRSQQLIKWIILFIMEVMKNPPQIKLGYITVDEVEEVAGKLSIFTVPVLLLYVEGKEYLREARIVHVERFKQKVEKNYNNVLFVKAL